MFSILFTTTVPDGSTEQWRDKKRDRRLAPGHKREDIERWLIVWLGPVVIPFLLLQRVGRRYGFVVQVRFGAPVRAAGS